MARPGWPTWTPCHSPGRGGPTEERLAALESRAEALLACGRHRDLIAELETLTAAHPLRERFWRQRMLALYRAGRQGDALAPTAICARS